MKAPVLLIATTMLAAGATGITVSLPSAYAAETQTRESLINSLSKPKTRSLQTRSFNSRSLNAPQTAKTRQFRSLVNSLRAKGTRQITVEERTQVAKAVKENALPAVDLEIYFDYNSTVISQSSAPKLATLGQALSSTNLKGQTFMIAGHTDAKGDNPYNQALSERRADAVKQYLVSAYRLDPKLLIAIGYGEEQLKLPSQPDAGQNRRVQVVNLEQ